MATKKPRINAVIDQADYDVVRQFCDMTGQSMSGLLSDMLSKSIPSFRNLIAVMDVSKALQLEALQALANDLEGQVSVMESSLAQMAGVGGRNNPRACNTGVELKVWEKNKQCEGNFHSLDGLAGAAGKSVAAAGAVGEQMEGGVV